MGISRSDKTFNSYVSAINLLGSGSDFQDVVITNQNSNLLNAEFQDVVITNQNSNLLNADFQDVVITNQDESLLV